MGNISKCYMYNFCISHIDLPKKRGPGRPKRSRGQNYREGVPRNISSPIISSNMVQVVHDRIESESEGMVSFHVTSRF